MATKTLMLAAGQDGNYGALVDGVDQTAASRTDGWTVAKISSLLAADFDAATKQVSGTFVTNTTRPSVLITSTTANALKTPAALSGVFANTAWTFTFAVRAGTASSQAGRMRLRVFRSVNADGSSATEITGATQIGTTSSALSTSADVTTVVTWTPGAAIQLRNEYLFFAIAWEITTASGSNSGDVLLRTGQASGGSRVVTSDFGATSPVAKTLALSYNVRRIVANSVTVGYAVKFTNNGIMVGSFAAPTSTGNKAITGVGFQPIALLFFADLKTADGASGSSPNFEAPATILGMVTLTDKACIYTTNDDNGGDSAFTTSYPIFNQQSSGTINFSAQLVSMDSDGFTLNFGVVSSPYVINFMAIAGVVSGKTIQAAIKSMASPTATGNTSLTGIGFKPDGAILLGGINGGLTYGFGVADSAGGQASYSANINGSATYGRYQRVNKAYVEINHRTVRYEATLASFDTDGLTLNFTTANQGGTAGTIVALCIKGLQFHVGNFLQKTSVGAQAYTGAGFKPIGAIFGSVGSVAATTIETTRVLEIIGASDGGHQFALLHGDQHVATAALSRALIFHSWSDISATPTKLDASATFNTLDSDGFTLNYPVADATAREVFYLAIGPPSTVPISKSLALSYHVGPLSYSGVILADGPTGYWRMEDSGNTAVDISGSGNDLTDGGGSTPSVPLATGLLVNEPTSKARSFGPVSFVSRGGALYPLNTFSIEMWIKRSTPGVLEVVLDQYNGGMQVVFNSDGTFYLGKSFVGSISQTSALKITDTNTHHVVITRNGIGGAVVYYLDGVPETPAQTNPTLDLSTASGSGLFIGSEWGNYPFTGTLDELAIYPTVLSYAKVSNHYAAGKLAGYEYAVRNDAPIAYFRLGESSGTVAKNEIGAAGIYQASPTLGQPGKISGNTAVKFTGANQVSLPSLAFPASHSITIEFWNYTDSAFINGGGAFDVGRNAWPQRCQAHVPYIDHMLYWDYGNNAANGRLSFNYASYENQWTLVHLTFDAATNTQAISLNGVQVASQTGSGGPTVSLADGWIGYSDAGGYYSGTIDEYAIYDYALTPAQRLAHFNATVLPSVSKSVALNYNVKATVAKTLALSYNVKQQISKTVTPAYNVKKTIAQAVATSYTVKKAIAKTQAFSYNVRVTVALKTLALTYSVRKSIAKTAALNYTVKAAVVKIVAPTYKVQQQISKTLALAYRVQQQIPRSKGFPYNVQKQIPKTAALTYTVVGRISKSVALSYNVSSGATSPIAKTLALTYNVRVVVAKILVPSYTVVGRISKTVTPNYNVRKQISQSKVLAYNVLSLSSVAKSISLTYNIQKQMPVTRGLNYNIRVTVAVKSLATSYNVRIFRVKTLATSYAVRQQISKSAALNYNIRTLVAKALVPGYNVRISITKALSPNYFVRRAIPKTVAPSYNVIGRVAKTLVLSYGISSSGVWKPLTLNYKINKLVVKTTTLNYNVQARGTVKSLTPAYAVRRAISKTVALSYIVRAATGKSLATAYNVRSRLVAVQSFTYFIRIRISKTLVLSYAVRLAVFTVPQSFSFSYNVRQKISTRLVVAYAIHIAVADLGNEVFSAQLPDPIMLTTTFAKPGLLSAAPSSHDLLLTAERPHST